jgi:hypothetical protein
MKPLARIGCCLFPAAILAGLLLGYQRGSGQTPPPAEKTEPPWFEDVTNKVGLDFVHDAGVSGKYLMPEVVGSGGALFDCDGDGRLDIYLVNNGGPKGRPNQLYRQQPDGTFENISKGSGLDFVDFCMGVAIGDVDNDGRPDVLVTSYGGVRLFRNEGGGRFRDVTQQAGLENPAWGTSAAFLDYDRDGRLDLVVVNYVDYDPSHPCTSPSGKPDYCAPKTFSGRVSRLFHNVSGPKEGIRFEDTTLRSGLGRLPGPGRGVCCADFDGDGWIDIFIANDGKPNHLWINRKDGTFKEEAVDRGLAFNGMGEARGNMGIALGDVNGDGLLDVFVTQLTGESPGLWLQGPRGLYRDRVPASGLLKAAWQGTGFGTVLADFDQDGALDLAVVNGRVVRAGDGEPALGPHWGPYAQRNQVFAGDGRGQFTDVSQRERPFCGTANVGRGLAWGDVDGDGAVDLLVTTAGGRARLYRNRAADRGHWLLVRALLPALRRDAYGAEVVVRAGKRSWQRLINPGDSYLCSSDSRAHFGLGSAARVDGIEVRWPDGSREAFDGGPADRSLVLRQGEGRPLDKERGP